LSLKIYLVSVFYCLFIYVLSLEIYLVSVFYCLLIYVLSLEIYLARADGWDPINRFNSATFVCLSQARTWISNVIWCERWLLALLILVELLTITV